MHGAYFLSFILIHGFFFFSSSYLFFFFFSGRSSFTV
jgi:hypothetical protein